MSSAAEVEHLVGTGVVVERGKVSVNVVPRLRWLSTSMLPPAARTMSSVVERPSPVPKPGGLVVKKGSKMRAWVMSSIPAPVSLTESTNARGRRIGAGGDRDLATRGHRVARVHDEVEDGLFDAVRVGDDRRGTGCEVELERDRAAEDLVEQLLDLVQTFVQVERLRFVDARRLNAIRSSVSAAARSVARCTESMRGTRRLEHLEVVLQQLDLAAHHRQHVVEVVGDAAGQPATDSIFWAWSSCCRRFVRSVTSRQGDHLELEWRRRRAARPIR